MGEGVTACTNPLQNRPLWQWICATRPSRSHRRHTQSGMTPETPGAPTCPVDRFDGFRLGGVGPCPENTILPQSRGKAWGICKPSRTHALSNSALCGLSAGRGGGRFMQPAGHSPGETGIFRHPPGADTSARATHAAGVKGAQRERSHAQPQERSDEASMASTHPLTRASTLLPVTDCNRNESGLQSARFPDHIICLYHPAPDHIICP